MAGSEWIHEVTDADFAARVLERSKHVVVLVDFWAEWCQPCRMLTPTLEKVVTEFAGKVELAKVNIDESPRLANQYQVSSIPLVVGFSQGRPAGQFLGLQPPTAIKAFLERLMPSESTQLVIRAAELEETDPPGAKQLYEQAVEKDPKNTLAFAGLADLALQAGDLDRARFCVNKVNEGQDGYSRATNVKTRLEFRDLASSLGSVDELRSKAASMPNNLDVRLALGQVLAADGHYADALETLVSIVEADKAFVPKLVREIMVKIFNLVGAQTELANQYRSRLARALY